MHNGMNKRQEKDEHRHELVHEDVVVKRQKAHSARAAQERDGEPADGQEDEGTVEVEGHGAALGYEHVGSFWSVYERPPYKQSDIDGDNKRDQADHLLVVLPEYFWRPLLAFQLQFLFGRLEPVDTSDTRTRWHHCTI